MADSQAYARDYDRQAQARQAEIHVAEKNQTLEIQATREEPAKPSEQDRIEARKALTAEHEAARQGVTQEGLGLPADGRETVGAERPNIEDYRRTERSETKREQGDDKQPQNINDYRRDFGDQTRER